MQNHSFSLKSGGLLLSSSLARTTSLSIFLSSRISLSEKGVQQECQQLRTHNAVNFDFVS